MRSLGPLTLALLLTGCVQFDDGLLGRQVFPLADSSVGDAASSDDNDDSHDASVVDAGRHEAVSDAGTHRDAAAAGHDAHTDDGNDGHDEKHDAGSDAGTVSAHCMREPWECP